MEDRRSLPPYEDELSLALLRSADRDEPSSAAYSKVATALGVSAAVGLGASLPAPAALASSGLSASAAARWSGSLFAKTVVVGVSSVLLVSGGVALFQHRWSARGAPPVAARLGKVSPSRVLAAPAAPSSPSPAGALASVVAAPTPNLTDLPAPSAALTATSAPAPSAPRPSLASNAQSLAAVSAVRAPKKSSLPEQVLSLDRARVALNSGDSAAALAEIAHYRSAWPRGVFLTEASVLEIEALAKRGEIVLAGMRAQAFVTAHPDSPQAERLRALIPAGSR
jgi:hypothetical protein